ncbi:MAG: NUDIX hydrolase [Candidatus Melainabacteria bacterium]|nr:NUDIX hydrolase [Candidatus Melainabacteria bacterium]
MYRFKYNARPLSRFRKPMAPRRRLKSRKPTIPTTRVSVVVVSREGILLVKHKKAGRLYWVLPGGRLEYGETFEECAVREVREETGLEVEVERFLYLSEAIAPDRSRHIVNVFLKARITGGVIQVGDEPVLAGVDFVALADLESMEIFPPVREEVLDGLRGSFARDIQYLGNIWV